MTTTDAPHKDYWAKQARKAIAEARAELCACGVRKCKEHGEGSE